MVKKTCEQHGGNRRTRCVRGRVIRHICDVSNYPTPHTPLTPKEKPLLMNGSVVISPSMRRERRVELIAQFVAIICSWRKQRNDLEQIGIQIERFSLHHDIETRLLFGIGEQAIDEILQHTEIILNLPYATTSRPARVATSPPVYANVATPPARRN